MARHTVYQKPKKNVLGIVLVSILGTMVAAGGLTILFLRMEGYRHDHAANVQDPSTKTYTREEFKSLVIGKTPDEVIAIVGRPNWTTDNTDGTPTTFSYYNRVLNPATTKYESAHARFNDGKCYEIGW